MPFDPQEISSIELSKFKNSVGALDLYRQGKDLLVRSGVINFFRIFSRPFTNDRGANVYQAAYSAAFTEGYNKALDDIVYFDEMYLTEALGKKEIKATFGALGIAIAKGDLTAADIKKLNR